MPAYDLAHWGAFLAAAVLLNLSPGPDMAFVLGQAIRGGRRAGTAAMLGVWTGALGHVALAAVGLSAIVAASATAFSVLKWVGAAYLAWLGLGMLLARDAPGPAAAGSLGGGDDAGDAGTVGHARRAWAVYRRGILVDLLNPKVAVFFLAFLPQFVVEGAGAPGAQLALHGVLLVAVAVLVEVPLVLLADRLARRMRGRGRAARRLERAAGVAMLALGARLAAA